MRLRPQVEREEDYFLLHYLPVSLLFFNVSRDAERASSMNIMEYNPSLGENVPDLAA